MINIPTCRNEGGRLVKQEDETGTIFVCEICGATYTPEQVYPKGAKKR